MGKEKVWITFEHRIGACGGKFQTNLAMIVDFPEKIICPSCPQKSDSDRIEIIRRFGAAMSNFISARQELEDKLGFRVVEGF